MLKRWQRLLTAALLSSSVFAATWIWYHFTDKQMITTNSEKPLAFIGKTIDEIQRLLVFYGSSSPKGNHFITEKQFAPLKKEKYEYNLRTRNVTSILKLNL